MLVKNKLLLTIVLFGSALLMSLNFLLLPAAAEEVKKDEVQYNLNWSMAENLQLFKGKRVNVILTSGQVLSGTVKEVKNDLLHLEKLSDKSYYDALILIRNISAIEAQFRGFER